MKEDSMKRSTQIFQGGTINSCRTSVLINPARVFTGMLGFAILAVAAPLAIAQGTVTFANMPASLITNGPTSLPVFASNGITAALYWSPVESNAFTQLGATVLVGAPAPGLFFGGTRTTGEDTPGGAPAKFQVRAWSGGYATYDEAQTNQGVLIGQSAVFQMLTGKPGGTPPLPPLSIAMNGLNGFQVSTNGATTVLTLLCGTNKTVTCDETWELDAPYTQSTCGDPTVTLTVLSTVTNVYPCSNVITRTWQAGDTCGNYTNCSQTVTLVATNPVVITCTSNKVVDCEANWTFDPPMVSSGCLYETLVQIVSTVTNAGCPQLTTRTWAVTNSCTEAVEFCAQTVLVNCTNCPVLVVTKSCPPYPVPPGGIFTFTGTVTNVSSVTLSNVVVVNDQPAANTIVFGPFTLPPGASGVFQSGYLLSATACAPYTDTLTASATGPLGVVFSNSVTAVCPGATMIVPGDRNGDGLVDQAELNAVLAYYWPSSPWVYMSNFTSLGGGAFEFALTNHTAWTFTVLTSTNLVDWTNLPGRAYPVYQFVDPDAAGHPARVYRLQWP
jgi:hypothetical protein